jgi:hypothetical protein
VILVRNVPREFVAQIQTIDCKIISTAFKHCLSGDLNYGNDEFNNEESAS